MEVSSTSWTTFATLLLLSLQLSRASSPVQDSRLKQLDAAGSVKRSQPLVNRLIGDEDQQESPSKAHFITPNGTIITAQQVSTASLPCEVLSLGDGVVTWFRRKDFHLLTVGHAVYSSDERFLVQAPMRSTQAQDWALQIRFVQERDAGLYECQLSTHPPSSLFVELIVVEARAEIEGGPEKYVKSGSRLKLTCHIRQNSVVPDFVFWYHDGRMISYEGAQGVTVLGDATSSTLIIERAQSSNSGNYSCAPSNIHPSSVVVHILNGEKPAAMQHSGGAALHWYSIPLLFIVECVFLLSAAGSLEEHL